MANNPEQKESLIRHLMRQKIISDLARKEGLDKKDDIKEQLRYMNNDFLAKAYVLQSIVEKVTLPDNAVENYYEGHKDQFVVPEQIRARHILIKVPFGASGDAKTKAKNKAEQILEWLKKGEKFETLAEHYSEDADSAKRGGDLGYLSKGRMSKSFEEAAFSLQPGQISGIVETDLGYHIIKVEDHKAAATKTLAEVKDSITKQLTAELVKARVDEFTQKAEKEAGLEINTEMITKKSKK